MEKNKRTYSRDNSLKKVKTIDGPDIDEDDDDDDDDEDFSCDLIDPLIQSPKSIDSQVFITEHSDSPKKSNKSPEGKQEPSPQQTPTHHNHQYRHLHYQSPQQQSSMNRRQLFSEIDIKSRKSLEPSCMLNDTVVEFYMAYLLDKLSAFRREKIHVFSTFFYNKIKKLSQQSEAKLNETVRRWDKHVKLFDKDYLIIPICNACHWVLLIVCFPSLAPAHDDPIVINQNLDSKHAPRGLMIIFDSMGYKYMSKFPEPVRIFLHFRWSFEKPNEEMKNFRDPSAFRVINAKVPKQRNHYDCGIYLLNSFEKFIGDPLSSFYKIIESKDLTLEWAVNPTHKRVIIKSLIYDKKGQTSSDYKRI